MITYEQLDAVIPRVPAGIDSGDLTDPDKRPAFVSQVLGWVLRAESSQTAPGSPESDEQGSSAPTVPENGSGENNGLSSWDDRTWTAMTTEVDGFPASTFRCTHGPDRYTTCGDKATVCLWSGEEWHGDAACAAHAPSVSVAWGVDRAEVTWGPPKPGTHESDLGIDAEWAAVIYGADDPSLMAPLRHPNGDLRGGDDEYNAAAAWSRENAR